MSSDIEEEFYDTKEELEGDLNIEEGDNQLSKEPNQHEDEGLKSKSALEQEIIAVEESIEHVIEEAMLNEDLTDDSRKSLETSVGIDEETNTRYEKDDGEFLNENPKSEAISEAIEEVIEQAMLNEPSMTEEDIRLTDDENKDFEIKNDESNHDIGNTAGKAVKEDGSDWNIEDLNIEDPEINNDVDPKVNLKETASGSTDSVTKQAETLTNYLPSFGGMFSLISDIKNKATDQLDKIYDALDPNLPEEDTREENQKSIKSLLDKLSPINSPEQPSTPTSSWINGIDKTFDYASDKFGQVLLGGLRKIENTVGVQIEPISSSSSVNEMPLESPNPNTSTSDQVGKIYSAGLSTLGKLGKTTVDFVASTKERLTPFLDRSQVIDRHELKKSFSNLFEDLSGNDALERLLVKSSNISVQLKTQMKNLTPIKLNPIVSKLKTVGAGFESLSPIQGDWDNLKVIFVEKDQEFVKKLKESITTSMRRCQEISINIEELRRRAETQLPPDNMTLLIYFIRYNLANVLSASMFLYLSIDFENSDEDQVMELAQNCLYELERIVISLDDQGELVDNSRKPAFTKIIGEDLDMAKAILSNATLKLQPILKYEKFKELLAKKPEE